MFRRVSVLMAAIATGILLLQSGPNGAAPPRPGVDWPQFRGIRAVGVDDTRPTPAAWDVPKNQGIRWKTAIEGLGHASPVVWGNDVFVATSISGRQDAGLKIGLYGDINSVTDDTDHEWRVVCLDKKTGAVKWQQTALKAVPKVKRHMKSTHANSTLATDGERLIAFFGSEGLYAFDMKGQPLWKKDLGVLDAAFYMVPEAQWETGSSPILHDNVVVVQADVLKGSFIAAFDARDGRELWRVTRDDVPTWSTPTVHEVNGRAQLIVNGMRHMGAYDFKTGDVIWKLSGGGDIPVPTPVVSEGVIYITNAHGMMAPVYAVRDTAKGDITLKDGATSNEAILWSHIKGGGYMATPLPYRGLVYVVNYNGVLNVYDAKTGERKYMERLAQGAVTASPVAADGKVYFTNEDGHIYVVRAGPVFELIGTNDMGESTLATPALSEGLMLWRTQGHVIAIGR